MLDASKHSRLIKKKNRIEKVLLINVNTFIPRKDSFDINNKKDISYNLKKRKMILIMHIVSISLMVYSSKINLAVSFQINMSFFFQVLTILKFGF